MARRNYYVVLGVASDETEQGVRAAFRDLAKRYHPDRLGPAGVVPFREVVEAYETLGDPDRRHEYDESLRQPAPTSRVIRDISIRRDLAEVRPSEDALFGRFARNFTGRGVPKAERVEELTVEVAVSEEEAARGTRLRVGIPIFSPCSMCRGRGCVACRGQGVLEQERPAVIDIPPMTGKGTTFVMPLSGRGVHNFYLRVRVRVDKAVRPPGP